MNYLFLDANIYLHYRDYEQLDWSKILSNTDKITVVVPPITRAEIDKIKDKGAGKVSNRARDISKRFREIFLEKRQRNIPMILCDAPKSKDYEDYNLDKDVQDNQFILSAILFKRASGEDVLVVAGDTNPLITAQSYKLNYLYLPDEYRLQPELSKEEKELLQVKKELEQYKNRSSKPRFSFENDDQIIKLKSPISKETELLIQQAVERERINVPHYPDNNMSEDTPIAAILSSLSLTMYDVKPIPQEIERYNKEVEEYHSEYEEWVSLKINHNVLTSRMHELNFILSNDGNAPTGELNIFIDFPKQIKLYDRNSKQYFDETIPPVKPSPPSCVPQIFDRSHRKSLQIQGRFGFGLTPFGYVDNRPKIWDLEKCIKKYRYHVIKKPLSQSLYYNITLSDGIYIDLMQCGNFAIEYSIVDTSLPKPITGKLSVVVE